MNANEEMRNGTIEGPTDPVNRFDLSLFALQKVTSYTQAKVLQK